MCSPSVSATRCATSSATTRITTPPPARPLPCPSSSIPAARPGPTGRDRGPAPPTPGRWSRRLRPDRPAVPAAQNGASRLACRSRSRVHGRRVGPGLQLRQRRLGQREKQRRGRADRRLSAPEAASLHAVADRRKFGKRGLEAVHLPVSGNNLFSHTFIFLFARKFTIPFSLMKIRWKNSGIFRIFTNYCAPLHFPVFP